MKEDFRPTKRPARKSPPSSTITSNEASNNIAVPNIASFDDMPEVTSKTAAKRQRVAETVSVEDVAIASTSAHDDRDEVVGQNLSQVTTVISSHNSTPHPAMFSGCTIGTLNVYYNAKQ